MLAPAANELGAVAPFELLNRRQLRALAPHVEQVTVDAGTLLAREATQAHQFVLLLRGGATGRTGGSTRHLGDGTVLGVEELLDGRPWRETVHTVEESDVLVVNGPAFRSLILEVPALREALAHTAA